jgi:small subunit ribosomal protein S13
MAEDNFRHIVRIANSDLRGNKPLNVALTRVRGIGYMYANMICNILEIDKTQKVGYLTQSQIEKIQDVVLNPDKYNVPDWMRNRRKDIVEGKDKHLVGPDLKFTQDNDIKRLKKIKSYRGYRHAWGLPVRGQRTKSNFRKNKGKAIGVKRRKGVKSGRV